MHAYSCSAKQMAYSLHYCSLHVASFGGLANQLALFRDILVSQSTIAAPVLLHMMASTTNLQAGMLAQLVVNCRFTCPSLMPKQQLSRLLLCLPLLHTASGSQQ